MVNINPLREASDAACTAVRSTDSKGQWATLCILLQRGPWLDLARLLQMIEGEFEALREKPDWQHTLRNLDTRMKIVALAKLRLAWLQVLAEGDPSWFRNIDRRDLVRRSAEQTRLALEPLSLGLTTEQWMEVSSEELQQIRDLIRGVAQKSVMNRSRNVICTARMRRTRPPRDIYQTPVDAYRFTEFYEDMDVSPRVLKADVKGASGRPARMGIMESLSLPLAEFEESRRRQLLKSK